MVNVNLPRGENQTHVLQACFNEAQKPGLDKAHMVDFKNNLLKSLWQPAKAPSRPPACKGSLMAKTMLCMQRLLTKQLLPKGCEAVGVGLHGVVGQEKNIAAKVAQTHMRMTISQHANSTQHTQNQCKNYIHIHTLHSLKHMQQHTQQKHKCTEHIKFKLGVHK